MQNKGRLVQYSWNPHDGEQHCRIDTLAKLELPSTSRITFHVLDKENSWVSPLCRYRTVTTFCFGDCLLRLQM